MGKFKFYKTELEIPSGILSEKEKDILEDYLDENRKKWSLIYKASRDGYSSKTFHQKCDYSQETLVIIERDNGFIFGGYTKNNWRGKERNTNNYNNNYCYDSYYYNQTQTTPCCKNDNSAFIFSLKNIVGIPFKASVTRHDEAIYCDDNCGPCFGQEIRISNDCRRGSSCLFAYYNIKDIDQKILTVPIAGNENFQIKDIEVFVPS